MAMSCPTIEVVHTCFTCLFFYPITPACDYSKLFVLLCLSPSQAPTLQPHPHRKPSQKAHFPHSVPQSAVPRPPRLRQAPLLPWPLPLPLLLPPLLLASPSPCLRPPPPLPPDPFSNPKLGLGPVLPITLIQSRIAQVVTPSPTLTPPPLACTLIQIHIAQVVTLVTLYTEHYRSICV